jgi:lipoprotein-anchoring transpeptidase ErfK/SrfK
VRTARGAAIGPWALHLTAFSRVLHSYDGGPGRVALHGRSGPLLADPLGSAASHGCVRMDNRVISRLARLAGAGTPVEIR